MKAAALQLVCDQPGSGRALDGGAVDHGCDHHVALQRAIRSGPSVLFSLLCGGLSIGWCDRSPDGRADRPNCIGG